jgi:Cu2+-exporting ATPase
VRVPGAADFAAIPGTGARARVGGREVAIGGPALLRSLDVELPPSLESAAGDAARAGRAAIALVEERGGAWRALAVLTVADVARPESREAVQALQGRGVEVVMLTGDARPVAEAVARELGIGEVRAEVRPEQKAGEIERLQRDGRTVAMVGDGVNDAPALATKMVQNLWWAAGYNIVAIPLAAGVLAPIGILLSPAAGAVLMSVSTIVVAVNAQLLRRASLA